MPEEGQKSEMEGLFEDFTTDVGKLEETPVEPVEEPTAEAAVATPEVVVTPEETKPIEVAEPVVEKSEVDILREQNTRLLQTINELSSGSPVQTPQPVQAEAPQATTDIVLPSLTDEQLGELLTNPNKFAQFVFDAAKTYAERQEAKLKDTIENALPSRVHSIVSGTLAEERRAVARAKAFYSQNPDLLENAQLVARTHLEIVSKDPNMDEDAALAEAARITRIRLGKEEPKPKLVDANPKKPAFAGPTGQRPKPGPELSEIQKQIADLVDI